MDWDNAARPLDWCPIIEKSGNVFSEAFADNGTGKPVVVKAGGLKGFAWYPDVADRVLTHLFGGQPPDSDCERHLRDRFADEEDVLWDFSMGFDVDETILLPSTREGWG